MSDSTTDKNSGRGWLPPRSGGYTPKKTGRSGNGPSEPPQAPTGPAGVSRHASAPEAHAS